MTGSRTLAILLAALIALGPTTAFAQGFDFGSDDTSESTDSESDDVAEDEGDGMVFDAADVETKRKEDDRPTVAVVALPSEFLTNQMRNSLESEMNKVLADIPENLYVGSDPVVTGLEARGLGECVREALCFGSVGYDAKVDQILIAQLQPSSTGSGKTLTIDLFDVKDKLTLKYAKKENLETDAQIVEAIKPLLDSVYDIRQRKRGNYVGPEDSSIVAPILAWTSLGLAVGAAATGGYFTYAAKTADDELKEKVKNQTITQRQAYEDNEAVKSKQTLSYIFYGIAGGLAAVSIVFFVLDIGGDVSNEQEEAGIYNLRLSPVLAPNAAGMTAGFSF